LELGKPLASVQSSRKNKEGYCSLCGVAACCPAARTGSPANQLDPATHKLKSPKTDAAEINLGILTFSFRIANREPPEFGRARFNPGSQSWCVSRV
jgi:hypothetical protein